MRTAAILLVGMGLAACSGPAEKPADLVLVKGRIVSMDPVRPEAEALAIRDGRVLALGENDAMLALAGPSTEVIDLAGRLATPGLIESHAHFEGLGEMRQMLDLRDCRSWEEVVSKVAAEASRRPEGEWILGRGWHQDKWAPSTLALVEGMPVHHALSASSPDHPVLLEHASGHALFANAKAMELAGVGPTTQAPAGGMIVKGPDGGPSGVFRESAQNLIRSALEASRGSMSPEAVAAERRERIRLAAEECLSKGITSFHDAGADYAFVEILKRMVDEGGLPLRLYIMLGVSNRELQEKGAAFRMVGYGDHRLTVRAVKRYIDGALGTHGAWLKAPYTDLPSTAGLPAESIEDLEEAARISLQLGYQLCVHAIGDRGVAESLDLFERTAGAERLKELRWRIEHAQHVDPVDLPRFASLGVVAAMQAIHCTSDGPRVPVRLGEERARLTSYPWRSLLDSGAVICNGTDAPVEAVDPVASLFASITRKMADGERFHPEQSMTRSEALASYTTSGAYAAFEEEVKGMLAPGRLGDVAIFSQDFLSISEEKIPETQVDMTILGGKVVFRRN